MPKQLCGTPSCALRVENATGSCQLMLPAASCKFAPLHCSLRWGQQQGTGTNHPREGNLPLRRKFWGRPAVGGERGVAVSSSAARPYLSRGPVRCPSSAGRRWSRSPGWTPRPRSGPATRRRGRAPARARGSALPPRPPSASPPPPAAAAGAAAPPARPSRHRHRPAGGGLRGGTRPEIGEENGEKRGCDGSTMTSWQLPPPV